MQLIRNTKADYQATLDAWNPYYDNKLTVADAKEISNNLFDLANLLLSWKEKEESEEKQCQILRKSA
ncbi:MAG: hypothetical protein IJ877_06580 [Candidatus Gastranaerophilales bacterium]|nr:hypothetical protein [Candidatus Gastranaerophilales bacterium]